MMESSTAQALPLRGPAQRIGALVLRHTYLLRRSWPRLLELTYWPTVQMIIWGLVTMFLVTNSSWIAQAAGVLLAGGHPVGRHVPRPDRLSLVFIEEMCSRNLGHLFVSHCAVGADLRAHADQPDPDAHRDDGRGGFAFLLYAFSIFDLGFALIGFFVNLIVMGWAVGFFVCGLVLRYGLGAESLAWFLIFALAPFSCVYYPLSILPDWLEPVAAVLPSAHVFEGMRALLVDGSFSGDHMMRASLLNIGWIAAGIAAFLGFLRSARIRGLLHQIGE